MRVTLSLETLEEVRDAGSVTRVNSNSHVSKVRRQCKSRALAGLVTLTRRTGSSR